MRNGGEFGVIGLGKMGGGLALQALEKGFRVVGSSRDGARDDLKKAGLVEVANFDSFREQLKPPRVVLLYIPAGRAVDDILDGLAQSSEPGDIVADGGNSYWGDSIRRQRRLRTTGIQFVDVGTSDGARHGACFMVGGERAAVTHVEPLLRALATDRGYVHAGPPGAGHFVKLVHNGIEFGNMQAIGEGFDLLTHYQEPLDIDGVLDCWRHGSVMRSWLIDLLAEAYKADPRLEQPSSYDDVSTYLDGMKARAGRAHMRG
jgi:6-phosphogluconate dehydrogenase